MRLRHKLLYGAAYFGVSTLTETVLLWAMKFYSPPADSGDIVYLSLRLFGVAVIIGRGVDAVADPLVGHWSDRARTSWGRRKPFIAAGTLPLAAAFVLLWTPPVQGASVVNFVYCLAVLCAFFFFFTVVVCPYLALLPEVARTPRDRVTLAAWQGFFGLLGLVAGGVGSSVLIHAVGFRVMSVVLGAVSVVALAAVLLVPSRRTAEPVTMPLRDALRYTLNNPPFRIFIVGFLLFWVGLRMILATVAYMASVFVGAGEMAMASLMGYALAGAAACFPLLVVGVRRWGQARMMMLFMLIFIGAVPLLGTIGLWPGLSAAGQARLILTICGLPLAGMVVLPTAILAGITDDDERRTGVRREGMYFGVQGFLVKLAMGLGAALAALQMSVLGNTVANPLGLRLLGVVAAAITAVGLAVFRRFPREAIE